MDKPIAWYDPTNGMVSTDKDSPLFTPLGQVLPLFLEEQQITADCPNCEYHRKRAQRWREEAYKQAGHPLPEREWVGLTDKEWHDIWEQFAWQHEDERHRRHEEFQNEMVAKHGAGHYYMDEDEGWNIQKDMIQKLVEAKLKEKNT